MARHSTLKTMKAISALLALVIAGLIVAGVAKLRHDYYLGGTQLIGWAFVPLAILLGFAWPARCKVERRGPAGSYALNYEHAPQSKPMRVTVEDTRLSVCASWAGMVSAVIAVIQAIIYFAH